MSDVQWLDQSTIQFKIPESNSNIYNLMEIRFTYEIGAEEV